MDVVNGKEQTLVRASRRWQLVFRVILIPTWLQIIEVIFLISRPVPKFVIMGSYWWFQSAGVLGFFFLAHEVREALRGRVGRAALFLDFVLVIPMFPFGALLWLFAHSNI
jgi:hypothetical protein